MIATNGQCRYQEGIYDDEGLAAIRKQETYHAAEVLHVPRDHITFLDLSDGRLGLHTHKHMVEAITNYVVRGKVDTILTFEPRGYTGHLDHIATHAASLVGFLQSPHVHALMQVCMSVEQRNNIHDYFIPVPPGYTHGEIAHSHTLVGKTLSRKQEALLCHRSQVGEGGEFPLFYEVFHDKREHFLVTRKNGNRS